MIAVKEFEFMVHHLYITLNMTNEDLKSISNVQGMQAILWLCRRNEILIKQSVTI